MSSFGLCHRGVALWCQGMAGGGSSRGPRTPRERLPGTPCLAPRRRRAVPQIRAHAAAGTPVPSSRPPSHAPPGKEDSGGSSRLVLSRDGRWCCCCRCWSPASWVRNCAVGKKQTNKQTNKQARVDRLRAEGSDGADAMLGSRRVSAPVKPAAVHERVA